MPIATPWTIDEYRAMCRDPAAHPRRVVEYGQTLGGISTGVAMRHGFYPEDFLQPIIDALGRFGFEEHEIDPDLDARVDDWRQLFTLCVVRESLAPRFGHPATVAFDTFADDVHQLVHPDMPVFDKLDLDGQTPSWWFRHFDFALRHVRTWEPEPWDTADRTERSPSDDLLRAFVETVLFHDSRSPRYHNTDPVETEEENRHHLQVALQVGWIQPLAVQITRYHRKMVVESLLGRDQAAIDGDDRPEWWPWPAPDDAR